MPSHPSKNLSSRDASTRSIAVRLPVELAAAIDVACAEQDITASEFLRALVTQWAYGNTQLSGPDAGYQQAKAMASQLAHAALSNALAALPQSHDAARTMLQGYYQGLADRRKRG